MDWSLVFGNAAAEIFSPTTAAYALAAIGLAVHFGYTGLLNFGQAAFMAIGAYGFAISILYLGLPFWPSVAVSLLLSVVFALILGIPTLRLRADYLAIVTIASAEILRYVISTTSLVSITGGAGGLSGFGTEFYAMNPFSEGNYLIWPFDVTAKELWIRVVGWSLVALAVLLVFALMRSPWGRVVKGIREDEDAVRSLGKNVYAYKMQSLVFGGALGTIAGILFILPRSVQPANYGTGLTFFIWTIMLLGGAATILGPVVGSMIFWVLLSLTDGLLQGLVNVGVITFLSTDQIGPVRFILIGVGLMLLVIFRPQGIFGNKKELQFNG
jgi:branched-chain amino acid transport system permease protein